MVNFKNFVKQKKFLFTYRVLIHRHKMVKLKEKSALLIISLEH